MPIFRLIVAFNRPCLRPQRQLLGDIAAGYLLGVLVVRPMWNHNRLDALRSRRILHLEGIRLALPTDSDHAECVRGCSLQHFRHVAAAQQETRCGLPHDDRLLAPLLAALAHPLQRAQRVDPLVRVARYGTHQSVLNDVALHRGCLDQHGLVKLAVAGFDKLVSLEAPHAKLSPLIRSKFVVRWKLLTQCGVTQLEILSGTWPCGADGLPPQTGRCLGRRLVPCKHDAMSLAS